MSNFNPIYRSYSDIYHFHFNLICWVTFTKPIKQMIFSALESNSELISKGFKSSPLSSIPLQMATSLITFSGETSTLILKEIHLSTPKQHAAANDTKNIFFTEELIPLKTVLIGFAKQTSTGTGQLLWLNTNPHYWLYLKESHNSEASWISSSWKILQRRQQIAAANFYFSDRRRRRSLHPAS